MKDLLHLRAPGNWINDPNGMIYYRGQYHLFYQHFPYEPRWGTMHWGHAVSRDLLTWEHQRIALYPSVYADQNGCFSGSAIERDGKLVIYYTGVRYEVLNPEDIHRHVNGQYEPSQLMLASPDGVHFDNTKKRVVVPTILDAAIGDRRNTRDPKVWRDEQGVYHMVLGTTYEGRGRLLFYRSTDGDTWEYQNCCTAPNNTLGWMWECPDLFRVGESWVVHLSPMAMEIDSAPAYQAACAVVEFDEENAKMTPPQSLSRIDYGWDLYAPQTCLDREGRRMMIGWMRMPAVVDAEVPWRGMMTAPRLVEVRDGRVCYPLHPDVREAFVREIPADAPYSGGEPRLYTLSLSEGETAVLGGYRITRQNGRIVADRSACCPGIDLEKPLVASPVIEGDAMLEILVNDNIVECYVNHGEAVLSQAVMQFTEEQQLPQGARCYRMVVKQ